MSASEEAAKAATSAIDAMRTNPSCLAALMLAAMFSMLSYYNNQRDDEQRSRTLDILMKSCFKPDGGPH